MAATTKEHAPGLHLFEELGFIVEHETDTEVRGGCLFCGGSKFYVSKDKALFSCKSGSCGVEGNTLQFMRLWYHQLANLEIAGQSDRLLFLANERQLPLGVIEQAGILWDGTRYIIPCFDTKHRVISLRTYSFDRKQRMMSLPGTDAFLFGAEALPTATEIWLCEGEWDALALRTLLPATSAVLSVPGANVFKPEWAPLFADKSTYICYDADKAGIAGTEKVSKKLAGHGEIYSLQWPANLYISAPGFDIRDLYKFSNNKSEIEPVLRESMLKVESVKQQQLQQTSFNIEGNLPNIVINGRQTRDIVNESIAALKKANSPAEVFVFGSTLARIRSTKLNNIEARTIEHFSNSSLSAYLARCANYVMTTKAGYVNSVIPDSVARYILAENMAMWGGIPSISGIVNAPVFAKDGVLCYRNESGYMPEVGLYCFNEGGHDWTGIESQTEPTSTNITKSIKLICNDLLYDIPFSKAADKVHALCMMCLPFMRLFIEGPTPIHLIDAPCPGTGKSLLLSVLASVFVGKRHASSTAPADEAEWQKVLTSTFKEGYSHFILDNVSNISSRSLMSAVTASTGIWKDRLLGTNNMAEFGVRCVWAVTTNNFAGTEEQLRRCIWIHLDAQTSEPWLRSGFKHKELSIWAQDNREYLIKATVTLIRAWITAGMPQYKGGNTLGGFEGWVRVMGGFIEALTKYTAVRDYFMPNDFLSNMQEFRARAGSNDTERLNDFVHAWYVKYENAQVSVDKLVDIAEEYYGDIIGNIFQGSARNIKLGMLLSKWNGKVIENKHTLKVGRNARGPVYSLIDYKLKE